MAIAAAGLMLARMVRQPPVLGYLVAGLIIGPYTLPTPIVSSRDVIEALAELGLVLLLFGIGLELGWRRIRNIGLRVLVIGVIEISALTMLGALISSRLLGISGASSLYLGGAMAISSSAILLKGLRDNGNIRARWGQTVVGILLVEDFAAVIFLTVLTGLATTGTTDWSGIAWLVGKLLIFCIAALAFGTLLGPRLMHWLSRAGSDETLLLAALGCCFGLGLVAQLLGLSSAAGAFLIGVVIGDTDAAGRVTRLVSPVRDMFGALFFISIGMLIDYRTLDDYILPALVVVAVFMAGKMAANFIGCILAGRTTRTAAQVGAAMPQMGEFSLAIGRIGAADAVAEVVIGPILAIATAVTSVLAPLTARVAMPLADRAERRAPTTLRQINLAIHLGIATFWSAFSLPGQTGMMLQALVRRILMNICIIALFTALGTAAVYTLPEIMAGWLPVSVDLLGLILGGAAIGLNIPPTIAIWRELRILARLAARATEMTHPARPIPSIIRMVVLDGIATALLVVAILLLLPLIIRLFALGGVSAPLPIFLLVAAMGALGFVGYHIHRVLEPAFHDTFVAGNAPTPPPAGASGAFRVDPAMEPVEPADVERPPGRRHDAPERDAASSPGAAPAPARAAAATRRASDEETDDLWRLIDERIATLPQRRRPSSDDGAANPEGPPDNGAGPHPRRHDGDLGGDG